MDEELTSTDINKNKKSLTYNKALTCPVCKNNFTNPVVKNYVSRAIKKDTDFFIYYDKNIIIPYFYDVWVCPKCGYAALKVDFEKIKNKDIELINKNIRAKWTVKKYPELFDVDIAIERYKLALLNSCTINSKASQKATICLKISWMYRIKGEFEQELSYAKNALECYNIAYSEEDFPFYGMDKSSVMYLIGELNRRIGDNEQALRWFGDVLLTREASDKIKDKARNQKDLIKIELNKQAPKPEQKEDINKKNGLFSWVKHQLT